MALAFIDVFPEMGMLFQAAAADHDVLRGCENNEAHGDIQNGLFDHDMIDERTDLSPSVRRS
jgi:hypothetical protein